MSVAMMPKHAVWPTGVPPVTTGQWDQAAWDRFEDGYRPKDYHGDRYDQQAWKDYVAAAEERRIVDARAKGGWARDPRSGDTLFGRVIHTDATTAIREASAAGPAVVAWVPVGRARQTGWVVYRPAAPIDGVEPELLCLKTGALPIPLSENGLEVARSAFGAGIAFTIKPLDAALQEAGTASSSAQP